jgi:hypothetical protein
LSKYSTNFLIGFFGSYSNTYVTIVNPFFVPISQRYQLNENIK